MSASRPDYIPHSSNTPAFIEGPTPIFSIGSDAIYRDAEVRNRKLLRRIVAGVCLLLALVGWPMRGYSQSQLPTVFAGNLPAAVAVNPVTNQVYAANSGDNTVTVVDANNSDATTTVTVGNNPIAVVVDPVTNQIYVANEMDGTVTVIDATNGNATTTLTVGTTPLALAINPVTNRIYVANSGSSNVSVIDGASNGVAATVESASVLTGTDPVAVAVNPVTNHIYVANSGTGNVTVINGGTESFVATVATAATPVALAVNPVTNFIYVANQGGDNVTVINGATNIVATTVAAGTTPYAVAVDPITNQIYVANQGSNNVTIIDGSNYATSTLGVGASPQAVAVNPTTNQIFVANYTDNNVTVLNGATSGTTVAATVGATVFAGNTGPIALAVNPLDDVVYIADNCPGGFLYCMFSGTVGIIDGSTYQPSTVTVGSNPQSAVVNPATNEIYVANQADGTVSPINGATGIAGSAISVGTSPVAMDFDPATDLIYVANETDNTISVIDGSSNTVVATIAVGNKPLAVAVNPVTDQIYVANSCGGDVTCASLGNVSVIDGASATVTNTVTVGAVPAAIAVDTVTNDVYVVNSCGTVPACGGGVGSVSVINGAANTVFDTIGVGTTPLNLTENRVTKQVYVTNSGTNTMTVIDGTTTPPSLSSTVTVQNNPRGVVVNPLTNMVYVANTTSGTVSEINGTFPPTLEESFSIGPAISGVAVNPVTNKVYAAAPNAPSVAVIDGAASFEFEVYVPTGAAPGALVVNPATNQIYALNRGGGSVTVITEEPTKIVPLTTVITPPLGGIYSSSTPTFTFTTASTFGPIAPPVQNVYFQLDTWEGQWIAATPSGGGFTGTATSALPQGTHIVYAYATDGQNADSTGMAQQLIGQVAVQVFTVVLPPTTTILTSDENPAGPGDTVTFTAAVSSATAGTPTGTLEFYDGATPLGPGTGSPADATFATSSLSLGSHLITAVYSGDGNFGGSTSSVLTQVITTPNPVPTVTSLSPTSANAGDPGFTLTVNGTNFVTSSIVDWNGVALATNYTSPTVLTATVPSSDLVTGGTVPVTVFNPAPGGGISPTPQTFIIDNGVPTLTSLSPSSATVGGAGFTLTVNGTNFVSTSVVNWNGVARTTTYTSPTVLTATVPSTDLATAGTIPVTVSNPTPGGGTSLASQPFRVDNTVPTITSISPTSGSTGGAGFTLTVNGTNFVSTSVVNWNGVALATTYTSATVLTAAVPSSDLTNGGTIPVTVSNPAPGGGTSLTSQPFTIDNLVPTLTSLSPNFTTAGGPGFTLTVNGTNFVSNSVVNWNGAALTTIYASPTQLTATVPSGDIAAGGTALLTVFNPTPGGGTSATSLTFTINNPVAVLVSLSQTSVTAGGPMFTLTVTGSRFNSGSVVEWNGVALVTTFVSATDITAVVPASDITAAGTATVTVFNPAPSGGASAPATVTINDPVPTEISLGPNSAAAGAPPFTLTVSGSNFVSASVVQWNGAALTTTLVTATQLTASVPALDIQSSGTASVTVFNPAPAGGTSGPLTFTINATNPLPTLASLSQTSATAGGPAFTLTLTGTGFVSGSVVEWNGVALTTTIVSGTQLTVLVPPSDISNAGTALVTVFTPTPGGGASSPVTFTINDPVPILGSLSQTSAVTGGPAFTLILTGSNFVTGSVVQWNGVALATTFGSATQLTATVPAADIATAGTASVTVFNAAPGGGASGPLTFIIAGSNPIPTLGSLSQDSAIAGGPAFTLTFTGTGFVSGTVVQWNGVALATTFVNGTHVTAMVPASNIANGGTASLTVFSPSPGGGTSAAAIFTINDPIPALGSLSQTTAIAGGAAFTLTLTGANFVPGSVVEWNGVALVTTFVDAAHATAAVPASDISTGGSVSVTALNPAPGGGTSGALTLTIVDFAVTSSTGPQTVAAGQSVLFTIATAPIGGPFPNPVTFTTTGLPAGAIATFSPASVTPGASATMTITTTVRTATANLPTPLEPQHPGSPGSFPGWLFGWSLITLLFGIGSAHLNRKSRGRLVSVATLALFVVSVGYLVGCAGGFPKLATITGTPAGIYTVMVTGASGTDVHSTTVTLIVQ